MHREAYYGGTLLGTAHRNRYSYTTKAVNVDKICAVLPKVARGVLTWRKRHRQWLTNMAEHSFFGLFLMYCSSLKWVWFYLNTIQFSCSSSSLWSSDSPVPLVLQQFLWFLVTVQFLWLLSSSPVPPVNSPVLLVLQFSSSSGSPVLQFLWFSSSSGYSSSSG